MVHRSSIETDRKAVPGLWPVAALVLLFAVLATLYSINTPLLEGSDEPAHFEYAMAIASGDGLPLLDLAQHQEMAYEAGQPPLYYALTALVIAGVDASDYEELVRPNPDAAYDPLALTNRNMFVHTRREDWPYSGAVLAVHLARLVSVLIGIGALVATYGLARTLFPGRPETAFAAAAFVAFLPQFGFVSGVVSNDGLAAMLAALVLWHLARVLLREWQISPIPAETSHTDWPRRDGPVNRFSLIRLSLALAGLGFLLGLAALSKESDLPLLPFALALLNIVEWRRRGWRAAIGAPVLVIAVFVVMTGWWYVARHQALGYWFGNAGSAYSKVAPLTPLDMLFQWNELEISFWGLFGWSSIPMPQIVYDSFHSFALLTLLALGAALLRWRRWQRVELFALGALGFWIALVFGAYANWMRVTAQAHGRLLFPALPAFALLIALGETCWLPHRARTAAVAAFAACMCAVSFWAAAALIATAYPDPQIVVAREPNAVPLNANLNDQVMLLGYEYRKLSDKSRNVLDVVLFWRATEALDVDYTITVQVFDENALRIGQLDTFPVKGMLSTRDWIVGEILQDDYPVEIAPQTRALQATVQVGLYDQETGKALQVILPDGRRVARVTLGKAPIGN
jgi:4-amino-4-deoxy-L-arabinose transferase-like glycosyltransferase